MPRRGERGADAGTPLKSYQTILDQELAQAEEEIHRSARGLVLSGIIAGFTIGVGPLLAAYVLSAGAGGTEPSLLRLVAAAGYAIGFVLVVLARTDLFTEFTTIAILPVLAGEASVRALARLWVLVFAGNLIGGAIFAAFAASTGDRVAGIDPGIHAQLAAELTDAPVTTIILSASVAGWLMGVLSWLVTAARDTISQVVFVWAIAFVLGVLHLHHSVSGSIDVLTALFAGQGVGGGAFVYFLGWTAFGNALGGIVFAVLIRFSLVVGAVEEGAG